MEVYVFNYLYSTTEKPKKNYSSFKTLNLIEIIHMWLLIDLASYLVDYVIIGRIISFLMCCHLSPPFVKEELLQKDPVLLTFVFPILRLESMVSKCLLSK